MAIHASCDGLSYDPLTARCSLVFSCATCATQLVLILVCKGAGYVFEAMHLYRLLHRNFRQLQVHTPI